MSAFIIAEVSANHLGRQARAYDLINAAADAGANAVKFQCWTPGTMCIDCDYVVQGGPWAGRTMNDLYEEAWTPWEWFEGLYDYAHSKGLLPFASVFDHQALAFLERINNPIYKISSFELTDIPLIQAVAKTGKPMIISTGMGTFDEIATAWAHAGTAGCKDITLLKCTSAYPATYEQANLGAIQIMRAAFEGRRTKIGVSDHTMGEAVPIAATALGATVIEKHITISREDGGPDATFSMEPHEFKAMVQGVRNAALAVQGAHIGPAMGERIDLRRSVYVAKDIQPGETITEEHLTTARPGDGMSPGRLHKVLGKAMRVQAHRGMAFHESMAIDKGMN